MLLETFMEELQWSVTVESVFSILSWEKDEYRKSLIDLSLEGIIQCK